MKLFGHPIAEKFKGFFATIGSSIPKKRQFWTQERAWLSRCQYYDRIFMEHPLVKSQILTLAGQFVADGIFLEKATEQEPHGTRAEDAVYECEQLNKQVNMPSLLYDTVIGMAKFGSNFWEKSFEPKFSFRIIPMQEAIEPKTQDEQGEIIEWRQRLMGQETASWTQDEIIHHCWNKTTFSYPYGTSLMIGLETELEILETIETRTKDFMDKAAYPKELYQIGDATWIPNATDIANMKSTIKNWEPGKAFVTNAPIDYKAGGAGPKAITNLDDIMNFYKTQCIDGLLTPPVSFQYSSTFASSKEMTKTQRANLILPLQRILSWNIEEHIYKPYLENLGFSVKLTPKINFEPPDANFSDEATTMSQLVSSGIYSWDYAARKLGTPQEDIEAMRLEKQKEQERQLKQMQLQQQNSWGQQQQQEKPMQKPTVQKEGEDAKYD